MRNQSPLPSFTSLPLDLRQVHSNHLLMHVSFFIKFIPALFVTNGLISGYSVMSKHTKEDILDGTVSVMVMSFFCGLGVYSHRLAYR